MISLGIGIPIEQYSGGGLTPVNTITPVLSGIPLVGETLTSTQGTWSGTPPISYSYVFLSTTDFINFDVVQSSTSPTYVVQSADSGKSIRCNVYADNDFGDPVLATTNYLAISAADLVNLQSYDASKFTLVGSKISVWADQDNTKSTWVQGTDSRRATLTAGIPVFPGGATGSSLNRNSGEISMTNFTAYIVYQNQSKNTDAAIFGAQTNGHWFGRSGSANGSPQIVRAFSSVQIANFGHTGNRPFVMCLRRSGATVTAFYNDTSTIVSGAAIGATDPVLLSTLMAFRSSAGAGGAWSIGGPMYAACFSSSVHTDAQVQDVIKGLYDRYGLSSLTATDRILGFGDSNTAGFGAVGPWLPAVGTALGLQWANLGISGSAMCNTVGTPSISGFERRGQITSYSPNDWVVIALGTNDVQLNATLADYNTQYRQVVAGMIAKGQNPDRIVLNSPMYRQGNSLSTTLSAFRDVVAQIAVDYGTRYFDLLQDFRDNGGDANMIDTLHANSTGKARWEAGLIATMTA